MPLTSITATTVAGLAFEPGPSSNVIAATQYAAMPATAMPLGLVDANRNTPSGTSVVSAASASAGRAALRASSPAARSSESAMTQETMRITTTERSTFLVANTDINR